MVTPDRRRRAVVVLVERFGVSERRACRVVGQHRSTQRRPARPEPAEDAKLRRRLRRFARRGQLCRESPALRLTVLVSHRFDHENTKKLAESAATRKRQTGPYAGDS